MKGIIKLLTVIFSLVIIMLGDIPCAYAEESLSGDEEIRTQVDEVLEDYDISYSYDDMNTLSIGEIAETIKESAVSRMSAPFRLLGIILVMIMLSAFLRNSGETIFPQSSSASLYNLVCIVTAAAVISNPLLETYSNAADAMKTGGSFMLAFIPVYVGITMVSGGIVSAGVYNTIALAAAEIMVQLANTIVMPLLSMMAALAISGSVFPNKTVDSIIRLIKKLITWGMTISVTLFSGFVSFKSTLGSTVDGFTMKSVKFVISGFVPFVGSAVSDAYSTVKGSFDIMRCTAGTAGTISIVLLMLPPLLEIIAFRAALWVGTAAAEMFGAAPVEKLLKGLESGLAVIMSIMVCFGVLFVISTAILMKSVS